MLIASDPAIDERSFAARTTTLQFRALKARFRPGALVVETEALPHRSTVQLGASCLQHEVIQWLINGWNTEYLLQLNASTLKGEALRHSLHWAFPQAYYAVFAVTLAYFKTVGFTEHSHAAVIRKVGEEMQAGHYPRTLSCLALGGKKRKFCNLTPCSLLTPFQLPILRKMGAPVGMVRVLDKMRRDLPSKPKVDVRRSLSVSWNGRRCENASAMSEVRESDKQTAVAPKNDLNDLVPVVAALHGQNDSFRAERGHVRGLVSTDVGLHRSMIARQQLLPTLPRGSALSGRLA